nr:SUMF1/EgtB/PvdO family nonheme iron enzyme [uncultured Treponema sp.]
MNKVVSLLSGALSLILSIFLIGCKAPSGGGSDSNTNYNYLESHGGMGGAVASPGIKIGNNPMFDNTSEVYAIAPGKTGYFNGSSGHADIPEDAPVRHKGVFLKGRKIELGPFIMGQYEVTQELYESVMANEKIGDKFLNATPSYFCDEPVEGESQNLRPVEQITWYDAVYFCNVLSTKTNLKKAYVITNVTVDEDGHIVYADVEMDITKTGYRLPTEAEW